MCRKQKQCSNLKIKLRSKWRGKMAPNGHFNDGVASIQTGYRIRKWMPVSVSHYNIVCIWHAKQYCNWRLFFCRKFFFGSTSSDTGIVLQKNKSGLRLSRQRALKIFLKQLFQAISTLCLTELDICQVSQPYSNTGRQ